MKIISILHGHNSSAAMIDDSGFVGAVSEERYDRNKNSTSFPINSIKALLKMSNSSIDDIDLIVSASQMVPFTDAKQIDIYELERENKSNTLATFAKKAINDIYFKVKLSRPFIKYFYKLSNNRLKSEKIQKKTIDYMSSLLPGFRGKYLFADHHTCHAYAGYFGFTKKATNQDFLIFTLDGEGDGLCATVSIARGSKIQRISETEAGNSIASFYGAVTKHMGMRVNEHEYKVMGLAPYCSDSNRDRSYSKLVGLFTIDEDLKFHADGGGNYLNRWLDKNMLHERFDCMAASAQKYVEELACQWIKMAVSKTGISNVVLSGGFFMNIKVNKAISELDAIDTLVVCPSAGDESVPIGGVFVGLESMGLISGAAKYMPEDLYLGDEFSEIDIMNAIENYGDDKFNFSKFNDIESEVANLLSKGEVVSRVSGRMEFGARALGNRSILGNPSVPDVVKLINDQIKNRDFWMPFACSVLEEHKDLYLKQIPGVEYNYMAISCDTTELAQRTIRGGIHPYDFTARPQIVTKYSNPGYHKIISEFYALTGIASVLNTSLNLHGEPLVRTPDEALSTFVRSGLKYMAIGSYLFEKK